MIIIVQLICTMTWLVTTTRAMDIVARKGYTMTFDADVDYDELLGTIKQRPIRPQISSRISPIQMVALAPRYLRKPGKKHMNIDYLKPLLGDDFQPERMSIEAPSNRTSVITTRTDSSWVGRRLNQQFNKINLTRDLPDEILSKSQLDQATVEAVERYLFRKAFCPVKFTWEDVGPLFWPRWLKLGECVDRDGQCSWPPGMHCVPAASTTVRLLRWHCKPKGNGRPRKGRRVPRVSKAPTTRPDRRSRQASNKDSKKRLRCEWLKVPYPITTECFCTC